MDFLNLKGLNAIWSVLSIGSERNFTAKWLRSFDSPSPGVYVAGPLWHR